MGEAGRPGGQRRKEMTASAVGGLALWYGHPAPSVVRASGGRHSILGVHLSSPLRLSVRAYSERETGWRGGGAEPTLSRLAVPIKDVSE